MQLVKRIATNPGGERRFLVLDLLVVALVAVLSITLNIVLAVFLGVIIAGALFVVRMSRSIIRRIYRCDVVSSRKSRDAREMQALERRGRSILVIELEGALFFGTGERLADEIEVATREETRCVILDLRRVSEIDSTGARIISDIRTDLMGKGSRLALAPADRSGVAARLRDFGILEKVSSARVFEDVDRAIEWAEDDLLRVELEELPPPDEMPLDQADIMHDLAPDEVMALKRHLTRVVHPRGAVIFQQGDIGSELFIVTGGTASAYLHQPAGGDIRLVTFAPGTVFGELAILDAGPRSASMIADSDLVAYALSAANFAELSRDAPAIAIKLLASIGGELSGRLRRTNRIILQLEI
jgi:CRP-like cAMP-binding protein/anti-anti-sigma regulatory factor